MTKVEKICVQALKKFIKIYNINYPWLLLVIFKLSLQESGKGWCDMILTRITLECTSLII